MRVEGIDERAVASMRSGSAFLVFVHEGGQSVHDGSWSVDSHLLTDTDLPQVLAWLRDHLPVGCCWSLAVVLSPRHPDPTSRSLDVAWIVGGDVLNTPHEWRSDEEQRIAAEMLERRHRVDLV